MEGAADSIDGSNLQVAPVDVAQVARDAAAHSDFACVAPSHRVVGAFDYGVARVIREAHGAIFGVIDVRPDAGRGFHQRLVAVGIESGCERGFLAYLNRGVLIEVVGRIRGAFFALRGGGAVADVVVAIAVVDAVDGGACQLRPGVITEAVATRSLTVAGGAAGERATQRVVAVAAFGYGGVAAFVAHPSEQVALRLVALRQRHVVRHGERLQQVAAG